MSSRITHVHKLCAHGVMKICSIHFKYLLQYIVAHDCNTTCGKCSQFVVKMSADKLILNYFTY